MTARDKPRGTFASFMAAWEAGDPAALAELAEMRNKAIVRAVLALRRALEDGRPADDSAITVKSLDALRDILTERHPRRAS